MTLRDTAKVYSPQEMFAAWAPADSRWSVWAKPVMFAQGPLTFEGEAPELPTTGSLRARHAAVILDLPNAKSIVLGIALAQIGFQPVPLYNATHAHKALVDMDRIRDLLPWGAEQLRMLKRRPEAPPVFLLNSERMENSLGATSPGRYDNRWCLLPQDMPSADALKAAGINEVVLVSEAVRDDLRHILHRYQEAKLSLRRTPWPDQPAQELQVSRPPAYKSLWHRMAVFAGLRRNAAGGFGAIVPDPGSSSGFYGGG